MRDYRKLIPRTPPEGMIRRALERGLLKIGGLIYRKVWTTEEDEFFAALEDRPAKKRPVCEVTCSECGQTFIMPYIPANDNYWGKRTGYGFYVYHNGDDAPVMDGDEIECPMCGELCKVKKMANIPQSGFVTTDADAVMSAYVLDLPEKPLVLVGWWVERQTGRVGNERYTAKPFEAYVFERDNACKLVSWRKAYSGTAGYFTEFCREWRQHDKWYESWGDENEIFGLTPELLARSCMANSKLDLYMGRELYTYAKYPVIYLRLYQAYPNVENVVTAGMSHLLDAAIEPVTRKHQWEYNIQGELPGHVLAQFDLTDPRPAQILRMTKEELRAARRDKWDYFHWRIYTLAKHVGDRMRIPEDIVLLHQFGDENLSMLIGMAPMGKILRYLFKQIELAAATDPEGEIWEESSLGAMTLYDYWTAAQACGWNLALPDVRWPKDLAEAHDRAMEAKKLHASEIAEKKFAKTFVELWPMRYASRDLMIVPAASIKELENEGAKLHHCVGTYGENHIGGEPIFFIRRLWDPGTPYYTLNYNLKTGKVIQNHTTYNRKQTKEIKKFEDEWVRWVHLGMPRKADGTPVGAKPLIWDKPEPEENKTDRKEQKTA